MSTYTGVTNFQKTVRFFGLPCTVAYLRFWLGRLHLDRHPFPSPPSLLSASLFSFPSPFLSVPSLFPLIPQLLPSLPLEVGRLNPAREPGGVPGASIPISTNGAAAPWPILGGIFLKVQYSSFS